MNKERLAALLLVATLMLTSCFNEEAEQKFNAEYISSNPEIYVEGLDPHFVDFAPRITDYVGEDGPNSEGFQVYLNLSSNVWSDSLVKNESMYIRVRTDPDTQIYGQIVTDKKDVLVDRIEGVADAIDGETSIREVIYVHSISELRDQLDVIGIDLGAYGVDLDGLLQNLKGVYIPVFNVEPI